MPGTASGQSVQRLSSLLGQISFKCLLRWALKKIPAGIRIRSLAQATRRSAAISVHLVQLYGSFRTINGSSAMIQVTSVKRQAPSITLLYLESNKQVSSFKRQASSFRTNLFNRQATSIPSRITSVKLQALSDKLRDPMTMEHGYWRSIRGARTKGLC